MSPSTILQSRDTVRTSPVKAQQPSLHVAPAFTWLPQPWISSLHADSSSCHALYAVSVRELADLPRSSFRPCIATVPLPLASGSRVLFPLGCSRSGLSPPSCCPCRANKKRDAHPGRKSTPIWQSMASDQSRIISARNTRSLSEAFRIAWLAPPPVITTSPAFATFSPSFSVTIPSPSSIQ